MHLEYTGKYMSKLYRNIHLEYSYTCKDDGGGWIQMIYEWTIE